jgi:nucleoside-diphosphate-sugar epimerase
VARILVTGAGGFIGRVLCPALAARGHQVIAGLRRYPASDRLPAIAGVEPRVLGEIAPGRDWSEALRGIDIVVHLAQRAHRRAPRHAFSDEPEAAAALARAAARTSVRRLLYMSSITAMGEVTRSGSAFRGDDTPCPIGFYARAKLATERALLQVADETGVELVILRPPLVYGPGVGANFRALLRLAGCGVPLPFARIDNRRSLIAVDNLVDLVGAAATHPEAAGRVLLAADTNALSTPALIRILAQAQGRPARLFAVPQGVFAVLRALPVLGPVVSRLTLSLAVDDTDTRSALGWTPPVPAEAALTATAQALAAR